LVKERVGKLRDVLEPLFTEVESLNERIREYDELMDKIAKECRAGVPGGSGR
jgi:hypothetical protein